MVATRPRCPVRRSGRWASYWPRTARGWRCTPSCATAGPGSCGATVPARDIARELLRTGRLLPVLDGFDELPAAVQPQALRTLNGTLDRAARIVLTSREDEYRAATREARVLTGAAAVSVRPLTLADLTVHLSRTAPPPHGGEGRAQRGTAWRQVLDPRTTGPRTTRQ
ncbi:hypothetical protein JBE27_31375 [Streptomyces albiflaviniger]|nr:hypothetical protein [Streptomyces albiflaviniger]